MLILSRRSGEEVILNGNIRITVVAVLGSRVKLGITAPSEIAIEREERLARPERANKEARGPVSPAAKA